MIMPARKTYDVIIIGGGPAGTSTAIYLLEMGIKPLILEKERFPRYHIGESLTGECGGCLRSLGLEEEMKQLGYPVKHGVNVYGTGGKNGFWVEVKKRCPDTDNMIPTWTWSVIRSSFDEVMLKAALQRGAEYMECEVIAPIMEDGAVTGVKIRTDGGVEESLGSEVLIDCSGQATFLANLGVTAPKKKDTYGNQIAIFSQLDDMVRDQGTHPSQASGNTLIFYRAKYEWSWFIPLSDRTTSVGVVVPVDYFKARKLSKLDFLRDEMTKINPELSKRVTNTNFLEEARSITTYSYEAKNYTGKGFLCVGDSHRFADPIFSFGVYLAMKEGHLAALAVQDYFKGKNRDAKNPFEDYETLTTQGQDAVKDLIDCFWDYPLAFQRWAHSSMIDPITDLFAGRLYGQKCDENPARQSMRRLMEKKRQQDAQAMAQAAAEQEAAMGIA